MPRADGYYWIKNEKGNWFIAQLYDDGWQYMGIEESIPLDEIPEESIGPKIEEPKE